MSGKALGLASATFSRRLTADNASEFWTAAWAEGVTGWRRAEESPFHTRNLFVFACSVAGVASAAAVPLPYVVTAEMNAAGVLNGAAEEPVVREFLRDKVLLIPLCGDSPALRYMADHGAAIVVGVDLAATGLRLQREHRFAGVEFTCTEHACISGATVNVYEGRCGGCTVRLFEGDVLELPQVAAFSETRADFVYDRASMMAIHPSMRERYVRAIAAVLNPKAGLMIERPVREEGDESGPPFTFFVDQVQALYEAATGRSYEVCTMLENRWYGSPEPGTVHYFEFLRVLPKP